MPKFLISDAAAHFKNQLLEELCHKTQMTQSFTLIFIERLNRDIFHVLRVMPLEYKVEQAQWADLVPLIQANLNQSPVASQGNHAPPEVFIGVKAAMDTTLPDISNVVQGLRATIDGMHREVATAKEKQTERNRHN
ncbi:hypothetical protein PHMEG_00017651 [Phytophthora megakarya]|uniref:Uncharacterized protein n=1 Tax=Phytophthora megakarya TaxID=4795 RepID=A0A225VYG3_9STRA|nr:hypothetical protein PHMEG_00017651 [Phytophthora megakarya]